MSRKLIYPVPQLVELERIDRGIVISPRQQFTFQDSGFPSVPAGGTSLATTHTAASIASNPALGVPGLDVQLTPDTGLIIEDLYLVFTPNDASGKLQMCSCEVIDNFQHVYDVNTGGNILPYTFQAISNDPLVFKVGLGMQPFLIRNFLGNAGSVNPFDVRFITAIVNLDGANARAYSRVGRMTFRTVGGLTPLVINKLDADHE